MKLFILLIVFFVIGCQTFDQEKGQVNMNSRIEVNVKFSEKFEELRARHAKKYCVDIVLVDRLQMEAFADSIFGEKSNSDKDKDETLFCIMRVHMDIDSSFNFIAHNIKLRFLDKDLAKHGLSKIEFGLCRRDDVFYKIIKFNVFDKEREKLLMKKKIDVIIEKMLFG